MGRPHIAALGDCVHPKVRVRIDEPRIDREARQVPYARARRGLQVATNSLDESVADYDRGVVQDLPRSRHDPRAH